MFSSKHPATNEVELTLLGGGVGESCAVHLGHRRWMIVDSFREADRKGVRNGKGVPAAKAYLDTLGVQRHEVVAIVLTHLHADHYRGLGELVRWYNQAYLILPDAIEKRRFSWLLGNRGRPLVKDVTDAFHVAANRKRGVTVKYKTIAVADTVPGFGEAGDVFALAPSDQACLDADQDIAKHVELAIDEKDDVVVKAYLEDQNLTSIALHVNAHLCLLAGPTPGREPDGVTDPGTPPAGDTDLAPAPTATPAAKPCGNDCTGDHQDIAIVLGGDVVNKEPAYGWQAVMDHIDTPKRIRASLLKVPHHGSEGALHFEAFELLLEPDAEVVVAPFTSSSNIPQEPELAALRATLGRVWTAAPSVPTATRQVGGRTITIYPPVSGALQSRRKPGTQWTVEVRDPAAEWQPASSGP